MKILLLIFLYKIFLNCMVYQLHVVVRFATKLHYVIDDHYRDDCNLLCLNHIYLYKIYGIAFPHVKHRQWSKWH